MTLFSAEFKPGRVTVDGVAINFVEAGSGEPLLLIHGYPQTHSMWHRLAPQLAKHFRVICPDLRGYGDSDKPESTDDHFTYSKKAMAGDMIGLMSKLGHDNYLVAGHDRGGRVTHRMCLDAPDQISRACVMDIVPTHYIFANTDQALATTYYHWFFLIQPDGLPERLIANDVDYYLREKLRRWAAPGAQFDERAVVEYIRCFSDPRTIHSSCEDYRAAAGIDRQHDEGDRDRKIECPMLVLWGGEGFVNRQYDVLSVWQEYANQVSGRAIEGCGHFLPEEKPQETFTEMLAFFQAEAG